MTRHSPHVTSGNPDVERSRGSRPSDRLEESLRRRKVKGEGRNNHESREVSQGTAEVLHRRSGRYPPVVLLAAGLADLDAPAGGVGLRPGFT